MKFLKLIRENILFISTLILLAFIPLYPKLPLLDVTNTWVYIRLEDFLVLSVLSIWTILLLSKRFSLKTPLTIPMLIFWIIGGVSMLHGVLLLFPTFSDVFSNVALLSFLRRIEYMSLFFVAYHGIKNKNFLPYVVAVLAVTLLLVAGYGFGQKFLGFPAYLTSNEEFAKGVPIRLSELSRVPSTFAGHYDLAAYLVLVIPILVSVAFVFRNLLVKASLFIVVSLGLALLFMTVSRVSVVVLLFSLALLLLLQRKKWIIISLFALSVIFLIFSPSLINRFGSTVSEVNVLVDTKTGAAVGQVKEVPREYFRDKIVLTQFISREEGKVATSSSIIVPFSILPEKAELVVEPNSPSGETLPQGTGYVNLDLSPVIKKVNEYYYQKSQERETSESAQVRVFYGDFVVKRAKAYDLSFTTRFQGEWPRTIAAFKRNIFLGSGYGSVSLAVDNDYLRLLGETGLLGFISFFSIFAVAGIYIKKIFPKIESKLAKSFILGFIAGTFGLLLNATLIDVFEASKVAFVFWMLMGITLAIAHLYKDSEIDIYKEIKKVVTSPYAVIVYLFAAVYALFSAAPGYYFVGDDFTWLRWAASCTECNPVSKILQYFTHADGFFYRPGTKLYFDLMYQAFWLNQPIYHYVSLILHFTVSILVFLLSKRVFKNYFLGAASAFLFLILSGAHEAIFWISSTGFLFVGVFTLLSLLLFVYWKERKRRIYIILSFVFIVLGLLFHEVGIIAPFLIILYDLVFGEEKVTLGAISKKRYLLFILFPIVPYLLMRLVAGSHWFSGDYSYNLLKLPFNFVGNAVGYFALTFLGPSTLTVYEKLRILSRDNTAIALLLGIFIAFLIFAFYKKFIGRIDLNEKKIIIFGSLFFIIALLPFLGLGNIASRYSYLSSFGIVIIFVLMLRKIYGYLLGNGKQVAVLSMTITVIVFSALQLFQLQKAHSDWKQAGEKSKIVLTALNYIYAHYSTEDTNNLYFSNIPIRNGEAWIFPVGLQDAAWLVFRSDDVKTHQVTSPEEAFVLMNDSPGRVFKFDDRLKLVEYIKTQSGEILPLEEQK